MIVPFILVSLMFVLVLSALVVLIKRLFQFDSFLGTISEGLDDYARFLRERTSRGLLEDNPEIKEFHQRTLQMIALVDAWSMVWAHDMDPQKKSVAELMSEDPGRT